MKFTMFIQQWCCCLVSLWQRLCLPQVHLLSPKRLDDCYVAGSVKSEGEAWLQRSWCFIKEAPSAGFFLFLCLSASVSVSQYLSLYISVCFCFSLSISLYLCLSLCFCLSLFCDKKWEDSYAHARKRSLIWSWIGQSPDLILPPGFQNCQKALFYFSIS